MRAVSTKSVTGGASMSLRQAITEKHGWPCSVPDYQESVELTG